MGLPGVVFVICLSLASIAEATETRLHGQDFITYDLKRFANNPQETVIKLRFQTIHPNGLILYSKGKTDFLLLDIYKGRVRYQVYLGGDLLRGTLKILSSRKELNDGDWHNVTLIQQGRKAILEVDSYSETEILQEEFNDLDLKGNVFIGGMAPSDYLKDYFVKDMKNFRGCLSNLKFRGKNLLREARGGQEGYKIQGKVAFECKKVDQRAVTIANRNAGFRVTVRKLPVDNNTFSTSFQFRSHIKEGLLLSRSAIKVKLNLRLSAGSLIYGVSAPNGSKTVISLGSNLHDGEWHRVNASIRGRHVRLQLDGQTRGKTLNNSQVLLLDFANKSRLKIFLGGFEDNSGFVGCILNLQIDSQKITSKNLRKSKHTNADELQYTCRLHNRCEPNPCQNQGRCSQDWDGYHCDCQYTQFEGDRCESSVYKPTCKYYRSMGLESSEYCLLDSEGEGTPYTALCNMTQNSAKNSAEIYTTIRHNKMTKTRVRDSRILGSMYKHYIHYSISMKQITELIRKSKNCSQYIRFNCFKSKLLNSPYGPSHAFWLSRDGERQDYWGGAEPGSKKCACGMQPSYCKHTHKYCNCDIKDRQWRVDEGYLRDKRTLPVTGLEFNTKSEGSYFTLGPLECWGNSDQREVPTIKPTLNERTINPRLVKACPNVVKRHPSTTSITSTTQRSMIPSTPLSLACPAENGLYSKDCNNASTTTPNVTTTSFPSGIKETQKNTTPKREKFVRNEEDKSQLSVIAVVMISAALVVLVLLSMKLLLPRVITCVRTHSKRGEYIVPSAGTAGYPARLLPLVSRRSSFRGKQLQQYGGNERYADGNASGGIKSYWV
ncbi:contactin-associated protein-like 2 [Montipora foliosa]|uniref:contactin-associated protein-like 2 n=1 Tax=Montipora foliosa TaxID=591990 RepID=UPI0035F1F65D